MSTFYTLQVRHFLASVMSSGNDGMWTSQSPRLKRDHDMWEEACMRIQVIRSWTRTYARVRMTNVGAGASFVSIRQQMAPTGISP